MLRSLNVLGFAVTVTVKALASSLALNGRTTAEVSDLYPTLVTPAGYVFSIWGLIYVLLLVFVVFQALPSQREKPFLQQISFLFVLGSVFNVAWLFLWHYDQIVLSVALVFGLLATLIAVYLRLGIGKNQRHVEKEGVCVLAVQRLFGMDCSSFDCECCCGVGFDSVERFWLG